MSIVDKVIAAVTPPESERRPAKARAKARAPPRPTLAAGSLRSHSPRTEAAVR